MSKTKRDDAPDAVFHLTGRVNWQKWHLMHRWGCRLLWNLAHKHAEQFGVRLLAGVIMSNHFHLVAQSPGAKKFRACTSYLSRCRHRRPYPAGHCKSTAIGQFMREVRRTVSRAIQRHHGVTGRFWERRFHARRIQDPWDLAIAMAYDHKNPVRAGMVKSTDDFEWSTAAWWRNSDADRVRCSPRFDSLPFGLTEDRCRELLARHERSHELEVLIRDLRQRGIWWHSAEGREELRRHGFGTDPFAA